MFPIALDLTRIPILLVGQGELWEKRRTYLRDYGATQVTVKESASSTDIARATIVMVAGLPREQAADIVLRAHALGKLVNVEDINELCDFYFTANVRRGDLVIAVSTAGASPTIARKIRDRIAHSFGEEWSERLKEIVQLRKLWKQEGRDMKAVVEGTEQIVHEKGWMAEKEDA